MAGLEGGKLLGNTVVKSLVIASRSPLAPDEGGVGVEREQRREQEVEIQRERGIKKELNAQKEREEQKEREKDQQWQLFLKSTERERERRTLPG